MALHADINDNKINPTYRNFPLDVVNDTELQDLNIIVQILSAMDDKAQQNIISYLVKRYGVSA